MGVARALRQANSQARIIALEPASSAFISTGKAEDHHVEGIGLGFVPPLLDTAYYDEARGIDEGGARHLARRLAKEEGIFAGVSSGLNIVGALQLVQELGPGCQNRALKPFSPDHTCLGYRERNSLLSI